MRMIEPDFWKGRGRYSKSACTRRIKDEMPLRPPGEEALGPEKK